MGSVGRPRVGRQRGRTDHGADGVPLLKPAARASLRSEEPVAPVTRTFTHACRVDAWHGGPAVGLQVRCAGPAIGSMRVRGGPGTPTGDDSHPCKATDTRRASVHGRSLDTITEPCHNRPAPGYDDPPPHRTIATRSLAHDEPEDVAALGAEGPCAHRHNRSPWVLRGHFLDHDAVDAVSRRGRAHAAKAARRTDRSAALAVAWEPPSRGQEELFETLAPGSSSRTTDRTRRSPISGSPCGAQHSVT